jgi:hypothetical protein
VEEKCGGVITTFTIDFGNNVDDGKNENDKILFAIFATAKISIKNGKW